MDCHVLFILSSLFLINIYIIFYFLYIIFYYDYNLIITRKSKTGVIIKFVKSRLNFNEINFKLSFLHHCTSFISIISSCEKGNFLRKTITKPNQLGRKFYCPQKECILKRHPYFWKKLLKVHKGSCDKLEDTHFDILFKNLHFQEKYAR